MGLSHSPKIVTNGLQFYYDMNNTQKSWKGKPTTNYINSSPTWAGDGSDQTAFTKGYIEITDSNLMYNKSAKTFLWSPGTSLNCYLQTDDIVGGTSSTSSVWTFSCYIKAEDRSPITSMNVYMYYPNSDGSSAGTITDAGNGWYRISRTRTGTSNYISLAGFTGFTANKKYYLSGAMLTKDDMAVSLLNGNEIRSNTESLLDLTGNHTITATSLTYNSDNTFEFDGTDNYIDCGNITELDSGNLSISFVAKININNRVAVGKHFNNFEIRIEEVYFGGYVGHTGTWKEINDALVPHGVVISDYNYYTYVFSYTNNYIKSYVNGKYKGIFDGQNEGITMSHYTTGTNLHIGQRYNGTGRFNGEIYQMKIYNRVLSKEEIKQNFNALRGRYGI